MSLARARGVPENVERLINLLQSSSGNEIEEALAKVRRSKSVDFEKVTEREQAIDKVAHDEKQQRVKIQKLKQERQNKEPLRVLRAIYDLSAGYTELAEKYQKLTPAELKKIEIMIPQYDPPTQAYHLKKVKHQARTWLEQLRLTKEAEIETPEIPQKRSRIHRVLQR